MATSTCTFKVKNAWILCGSSDYSDFVPCFVGDDIKIAYFVPCFVGDGIETEQIAAEWGYPYAF